MLHCLQIRGNPFILQIMSVTIKVTNGVTLVFM